MGNGTEVAHNTIIQTVNQSAQISHQIQNINQFTTLVEDLGFHLKLLGLTASVEAAKHNQSETLNELCRDIRQLGEKFRHTASQFRSWVEPLNELAQDSAQNMVIAQNALVQLAPLSQKVSSQIQSQENLVNSALLPRIEAANTIEQALRHSNAVHNTLVSASVHIQDLATEIRDLFEISSAIMPSVTSLENSKAALENAPILSSNSSDEASMEWFKRDLMLRELSGEMAIAVPNIASDMLDNRKSQHRTA